MSGFRVVGAGFFGLLLFLMPAVVWSEEEAVTSHDSEHVGAVETAEETAPHGGEASAHHGRAHRNEVAVFLGETSESGHDAEFTWGLDYKRRISDQWAAGVIFDYAGGELRNSIVAPSISFWPGLGNLQLIGAVGVEFHNGRNSGGHEESEHGEASDSDETYFLVRLGAAYDIHLGGSFGLVPQVNLDFVESEEVWVYGLGVSYGF